MAGKPGRSGGARPGAGRPPKEPEFLAVDPTDDPLVFMRSVMNDPTVEARLRLDAAKSLAPFVHMKKGEGGKKEKQAEDAAKVASRFASAVPPRLVAAGGRKV